MFKGSIGKQNAVLLGATTAALCLCILLANLFVFKNYNTEVQREASVALEQGLTNQLQRDALLVAQSMARQLSQPVSQHNIREIYEILRQAHQSTEIGYTYVFDLQGNIIHDGTSTLYHYGKPIADLLPAGLQANYNNNSERIGRSIHTSVPILGSEGPIAGLRISVAFNQAQSDLDTVQQLMIKHHKREQQDLLIAVIAISLLLLLLVAPIVYLFGRRISRPLQLLAEKCQQVDNSREISFQLNRKDELGTIAATLETLHRRLAISHERIDKLSDLDPLTQLSNRRMFTEELEQLINWARHEKRKFGLLFIDLDDFKQINDSAGHDTGDLLLQEVASRLTHLIHASSGLHSFPIPEKLLLARLGGDEFVAIVPSFDSIEEVSELASDIITVLEPSFDIAGEPYSISASIGITIYPDDGDSTSELLKHSDIAMYAAKNAGRNRFRFFEARMNRTILEKQLVRQGVKTALSEHQFQLRYQPIFDLQHREIIGAEAVIRWMHPTQGELSPASFIPLIEKSEQIIPVTLWVLEHACRDLGQHFLPAKPDFKLSINISGAAFLKSQISANIPLLMNTHNIPGNSLHLELTETSVMADFEACRAVILNWKELGVNVWIDDFGTGYSSLSYLHRLPIDGLKIDQSFVMDMDTRDTRRIVEIIIAMANTLKLDTVSEGIESEEDLLRLTKMGNRYGQGYFLSKPLTADDLIDWLAENQLVQAGNPSAS